MTADQRTDIVDAYPHRRRASDRARERAGRAAYLGDRAGLLIATGTVEALMSARSQGEQVEIAVMRRRLGD